jgi:hypothetical protein
MDSVHPLDKATALSPGGDGRLHGSTSDAYWNIAGPFGGVTAATLLRAVVDDPRLLGSPVALTVNYCAALASGPFTVTLVEQRSGRSTQHWSLTLHQGAGVAATASVVCGVRRPTWAHQSASAPRVPPPQELAAQTFDVPSKWIQRYRFRFVEGQPVFRPAPDQPPGGARSVLWMSDAPDRPLDFVSLAAISDAFILRMLQVRGVMVPMGTVSLTTYFHATAEEVQAQGTAPLCGVADTRRFSAGFHDQTIELWGSDGMLLASGGQVVWYRE